MVYYIKCGSEYYFENEYGIITEIKNRSDNFLKTITWVELTKKEFLDYLRLHQKNIYIKCESKYYIENEYGIITEIKNGSDNFLKTIKWVELTKEVFLEYIRERQKIILNEIGNKNQSRYAFAKTNRKGPNTQTNSRAAPKPSNLRPTALKYEWRGPPLPDPRTQPQNSGNF